jgi:hypothetical protein
MKQLIEWLHCINAFVGVSNSLAHWCTNKDSTGEKTPGAQKNIQRQKILLPCLIKIDPVGYF